MGDHKSKFFRYFREYEWSNVLAMIRNNRRDPLTCDDSATGRLVVITGATSGIGYATARKFASQGADLICINRNKEKSEALSSEIRGEFGVECSILIADLGKLEDVRAVCEELLRIERPINVLIHNAGVYLTKKETTKDGIEKVFMVNYLASFIINYRLKERLKSQGGARIILVNSEGHRFAAWGLRMDDLNWDRRRYTGLGSYGSAKLAQLLTMLVFDEYFAGSGVTINAMHPGAVRSDTGKENGPVYRWFKQTFLERRLRPAAISSEALYYLGVSKETAGVSGKFFNLTTLEEPTPPALDIDEARALWALSLKFANLE